MQSSLSRLWVRDLALTFLCCVISGQFLHVSELQGPIFKTGIEFCLLGVL